MMMRALVSLLFFFLFGCSTPDRGRNFFDSSQKRAGHWPSEYHPTIDCGLILIALFAIIVYPNDFALTQESTGRKFLPLCLKDF
jgi:hypothetical protein